MRLSLEQRKRYYYDFENVLKYIHILKNEKFIAIYIGHFSREIKTNIKKLYTKISIQVYLLRYNRFKFALDEARRSIE